MSSAQTNALPTSPAGPARVSRQGRPAEQKQRVGSGLIGALEDNTYAGSDALKSPLQFSFNNRTYSGVQGDTLASALLANGVRLVGRSFKYHRPRGIFSAGPEEPNALVELRRGAFREPNTRATVVELFDGLSASSQNHKGPLNFDIMAVNDMLSPFLSAGFYYKTFMWPAAFWEKLYEPVIRAAAGLGSLSGQEDPDCYDKGFLHTELLIIGAGPAGLSAAITAARAGVRLIIADEDFLPGGRLNHENTLVNDKPGALWAKETVSELRSMPNVRFMSRTTVFGAYDHGIYGALERLRDHLPEGSDLPRQVLWRIYARHSLVCTGATERSIAFGNNDRPGIMLAGAVRTYLHRFGVAAGKQVALFTNNDDGLRTANDLHRQGVEISGIIDTRQEISADIALPDVPIYCGNAIVNTRGRLGIRAVQLRSGETLPCDTLAVSGGWSPQVHLTCHHRGRPLWNDALAGFVPGEELPPGMRVAGAAAGSLGLGQCLQTGHQAAMQLLSELQLKAAGDQPVPRASDEPFAVRAFWHVSESRHRCWVDLQNDVTSKDLSLSVREGFVSVEHLKRYTTLGMATDQGKTSNLLGLALLAELRGQSIEETGTTIFRPPYTPVPIAALAGRSRGRHFRPVRHTPAHHWAAEQGAVFVESGNWLRAQWFPKPGESHWRESVDREVLTTRSSVGICDVTTLGKIDIQGKDAGVFLDRVYANLFSTLAVGKVRYGLMLREDGFAIDDGTTARLADDHYLMTTTTANAVSVFRHLEFARQCLWPTMDVHLISVTEQWAQVSIAGPDARRVLEPLVDEPFDISNDAFAYMACAELTICNGTPARLFRISFSGELAYELAVPARFGHSLMDALMASGKAYNICAYGTEALGVMRIEKGHAAGNELNGQTSATHLGLGKMLSKKKDFIGRVLAQRDALSDEHGLRLVGFIPVDPSNTLQAGSHLIDADAQATLDNDQGWISSVAYSPNLSSMIGLGFIRQGDQRFEQTVMAVNPLQKNETLVRIVSPHFIDPEGARLRV